MKRRAAGVLGSGVSLIMKERMEQIQKHGRTIEWDKENNDEEQILEAMLLLIASTADHNMEAVQQPPNGWNEEIWTKMINKPIKEKLAIIGALAAAEIDRINE